MLKTRIATIVLLLVLMLTITLTLTTNATATEYLNVNWGHMLSIEGGYLNEYNAEVGACGVITDFMSNKAGWTSWNAYHNYTTSGYLQQTIVYRQQHDTWAHDFWVGDFYPEMTSGTLHYNFYGEGFGSNNIHDHGVYAWTDWPYSKQHFTFIWTCACGNVFTDPHNQTNLCYGFYDDINGTGLVGMPFAWPARGDLSLDGYDSPDYSTYCYLGWNSTSLGMSTYTGNPLHPYYTHFIYYFYEHLVDGYSIKSSLDYASDVIWNCDWRGQNNPLGYGTYFDNELHWINVFGKSTMTIP